MMFNAVALLLVPALALGQQVHQVDVGLNGLAFTPNTVTAAIGDIVNFNYHPKNHSVTQSTFAVPCVKAVGTTGPGVDSGFKPVAAGQTLPSGFAVNVTTTKPLWFFCAQATHCLQGMVFAINAPATGNTFDAFLNNAKSGGTTPPPVTSNPPPTTNTPPPTTGNTPPTTGSTTPPSSNPDPFASAGTGTTTTPGAVTPPSTDPNAPGSSNNPLSVGGSGTIPGTSSNQAGNTTTPPAQGSGAVRSSSGLSVILAAGLASVFFLL